MSRSHAPYPFVLLLILATVAFPQAAGNYEPGPDSKPQSDVPKGEILKFSFDKSKIFPGTTREYSIYVPAQYRPDHPACVYVGQDGVKFEAPIVFDNLIYRKEMPVTVGVFVMHGKVPAANAAPHSIVSTGVTNTIALATVMFAFCWRAPSRSRDQKPRMDGRSSCRIMVTIGPSEVHRAER
jgi:hypothetical protein